MRHHHGLTPPTGQPRKTDPCPTCGSKVTEITPHQGGHHTLPCWHPVTITITNTRIHLETR